MTRRSRRTNHRQDRHRRAGYRRHAATISEPCRLCGQPINYQLRYPHPDSWTLEHVHPIAHGGALRDPGNYASAHLRCQRTQAGRLATPNPTGTTTRRW